MKIVLAYDTSSKSFTLTIPSSLDDSLFTTTLEIGLGFSRSSKNKLTLSAESFSGRELFEVTRKIIDYLSSEKVDYIADKQTSSLIKSAADDLMKSREIKTVAKKLLRNKSRSISELASPEFKRKLKDYQEEPVRLMINLPFA